MDENTCIDCLWLEEQGLDFEVIESWAEGGAHIRHIVTQVPEEWFA